MSRFKGKILKGIIIALAIFLATAVFAIYVLGDASDYLLIRGFVRFTSKDMQHRQIHLLYKTDHQALLEACNELSKQVASGGLAAGTYSIRREPNPESVRFPQPILDLEPSYVYIDENDSGRVMLEMMGGLGHFGVLAYTEDYKKPSWSEYGDKELISRLWYYDDGYDGNPEHEKRIEALRPEEK